MLHLVLPHLGAIQFAASGEPGRSSAGRTGSGGAGRGGPSALAIRSGQEARSFLTPTHPPIELLFSRVACLSLDIAITREDLDDVDESYRIEANVVWRGHLGHIAPSVSVRSDS